ncbi:hypothetical protein RB653_005580 [Dictyostelium firmibasis]|uniref:Uncharacterized protein n=1 Tax=Dictyostelium firmibasis TaxID=79012 RepID=A0AAN7U1K1_9MYCE
MENKNGLSFMVYFNGEINRVYLNEIISLLPTSRDDQEEVYSLKTSTEKFLKLLSNEPILQIPQQTNNLKLSIDSPIDSNNTIDFNKLKSNSIVYIKN